jgi:hypothetical protein
VLLLARLLRQRRIVCANFVLADSHLQLGLEQQDVFTASQVIHLKPLIGADLLDEFTAANPFVTRFYPNRINRSREVAPISVRSRGLSVMKGALELLLELPAPLIELACRRLYAWHLRRRAGSWRSPDEVRLQSDYLKLHTQSHRHSVLQRFDTAVELALQRATRAVARPVAAGGRR